MKRIFIFSVALMCAIVSFAQTNIAGKVQDTQSNPIAYATVSLLRSDSSLVTGAITDDAGAFALSAPSGKYLLQVSFIGYQTVCQSVRTGSKDLLLTLHEETEQLGEVEVKAKKQLIER